MITQEELKESLHYDPDTGIFTWRKSKGPAKKGTVAGKIYKSHPYIKIGVCRHSIDAHRLAWLYVYGEWPTMDIDHINRDPTDNRICNLRHVSRSENNRNRVLR